MRRFYQSVDLRSRSQMTDFLTKHFRYPTMNSWNNAVSYACNLKIHSLGLCDEVYEKLYDLTVGEIAKRLNCSPQYVSDQKQKSLKHLRKRMAEGGDENG